MLRLTVAEFDREIHAQKKMLSRIPELENEVCFYRLPFGVVVCKCADLRACLCVGVDCVVDGATAKRTSGDCSPLRCAWCVVFIFH